MSPVEVELAPGSRVRVLSDPDFGPGPWPAQPTGTVTGHPSVVNGRNGPMLTYWIEFDSPQRDADGDGPYATSQVLGKYLAVLDEGA